MDMGTTTKALRMLDFFSLTGPEIGLSQMTRLTGYNKATALRLLTELVEYGLVEQDSDTKQYRLGSAVLRLAHLRESSFPTRTVARPFMKDCVEQSGECCHLALLDGFHLNTIAVEDSSAHSTRVVIDAAVRLPLHATASGLAVTAFGSPALREWVQTERLEQFTSSTIVDPAKLEPVLERVRTTGLAESPDGFEIEVHGIAAPLFDAKGLAIGSIAIATPSSRMNEELRQRIYAILLNASANITRAWGGSFPASFRQHIQT